MIILTWIKIKHTFLFYMLNIMVNFSLKVISQEVRSSDIDTYTVFLIQKIISDLLWATTIFIKGN